MALNKSDLPHAKRDAFLRAYAKCGNVTQAAKRAKISKQSHYDWLKADPEYSELFKSAHEEYCDLLRSVITEGATVGWEEAIVYGGAVACWPKLDENGIPLRDTLGQIVPDPKKPVLIRKRYPVLLMFEAKKHMPEYREKFEHEVSGPGGGALELKVSFVKPPAA